MKKFIQYTILSISALLLSGCLAATVASPQAQSKYQQFQREEGTALLYITRESAFGGGAVTTYHSINNVQLGELGNGDGHIIVALDPGTYALHITGDLGLSGSDFTKEFTINSNEEKLLKYEIFDLHGAKYSAVDFHQHAIAGTKLSNFTKLITPEATAKRKKEKDIFENTKKINTIKAFEAFQKNYPKSKYSKEAQEIVKLRREAIRQDPQKQKEVNENIQEYLKTNDLDGLFKYVNENPDVIEFINNDSNAYLLFSGPKELPIIKILQYKKNGISEGILSSQIKSLNKKYTTYSLDEIQILINYGVTDKILTTIIDITTKVKKEEETKKRATIQPSIQFQQQPANNSSNNVVQDTVTNEVSKAILGEVLKNLF